MEQDVHGSHHEIEEQKAAIRKQFAGGMHSTIVFSERIRQPDLYPWFERELLAKASEGTWRPGFLAVKKAILDCIPNADEMEIDPDRKEILVSINGNSQPYLNLSAGQRMMFALVADIAIKAVTQNAHLLPDSTDNGSS